MSPLIRSLLRDWRKHYLKQQEQLCHKMVTKDITFGSSPYHIDPLSSTLESSAAAAAAAADLSVQSGIGGSSFVDYSTASEYPYSWNFSNSNRFSRNGVWHNEDRKNLGCDSSFQHEDDDLRYYFKPEESNLYLWHFVLYIKYTGEEICGMLYIKDLSERNQTNEAYADAATLSSSASSSATAHTNNIQEPISTGTHCRMVQMDDRSVEDEYQVLIRLLTPNSNTAIPLNKAFDFTAYVDKDIFQKSKSLNTIFDYLWNFLNKNIVINKSTNNHVTLHSGPLGKCWNRTILQNFKNLFPELYGLYHYTEMDQMYVQNWIRMQKYESDLKRKPSNNNTMEHEAMDDNAYISTAHTHSHKRNLDQQNILGQGSVNSTDPHNNGYYHTLHYLHNTNTGRLHDHDDDDEQENSYGNKKRKLNAQNYSL
ncbi:hypothetical protein ACO0QE_002461 [Hanseniaspora vineae]